jgi:hypothetical protein
MTPKTKTLLEELLSKSVRSEKDLDYLENIFKYVDDSNTPFFKYLAEMDETPKAIRGTVEHLNNVRNSTAFSTVTREIERVRVRTAEKISA